MGKTGQSKRQCAPTCIWRDLQAPRAVLADRFRRLTSPAPWALTLTWHGQSIQTKSQACGSFYGRRPYKRDHGPRGTCRQGPGGGARATGPTKESVFLYRVRDTHDSWSSSTWSSSTGLQPGKAGMHGHAPTTSTVPQPDHPCRRNAQLITRLADLSTSAWLDSPEDRRLPASATSLTSSLVRLKALFSPSSTVLLSRSSLDRMPGSVFLQKTAHRSPSLP